MSSTYIIYAGPHDIDLSPLKGKLVDIEGGGMQGLRPDLDGFPSVVLALADAMPQSGAAAGIPQEVYDHFVTCNETIASIDDQLTTAAKLIEVLRESRAFYVDARQNDISLMADAMKSRAQRRKDASILVPFEAVLKYSRQIGDKAFQTRKKNAQAKAAGEPAQSGEPAKADA